ncbi:MAG: hypothetical protein A3B38_02085 [Candidatus Levybacteria bacterium RIFCSPLOWO2_01_FULL_36_13]|nr:MAG: hypothetical protein A2684_03320 [Candidatus Levybacteria bacterium RIFCSPHIGHO2_01_FULL_36_15b]OGH35652.1 MAG: hypothetical protein A3B38_02085 [Candidatus Levybacteria bacterium RIFCSPLOWO2_01_FULL_36_13]
MISNIVLFSDREDVKHCIAYLRKKGVPILYIVSNKLKDSNYNLEIRKNIVDRDYKNSILISYYYGSLIEKKIFNRFKVAINFHPAPLPLYRGVKCGVHAILNEEKKFGVSCHIITERFDDGEILGKLEFPIDDIETGYSINIKSRKKLYDLFKRYINKYIFGENVNMYEILDNISYNLSSPTYFSGKDFEKLKCLDGINPYSVYAKKIIRAMWHPKYMDTYYTNKKKEKIYLSHTPAEVS